MGELKSVNKLYGFRQTLVISALLLALIACVLLLLSRRGEDSRSAQPGVTVSDSEETPLALDGQQGDGIGPREVPAPDEDRPEEPIPALPDEKDVLVMPTGLPYDESELPEFLAAALPLLPEGAYRSWRQGMAEDFRPPEEIASFGMAFVPLLVMIEEEEALYPYIAALRAAHERNPGDLNTLRMLITTLSHPSVAARVRERHYLEAYLSLTVDPDASLRLVELHVADGETASAIEVLEQVAEADSARAVTHLVDGARFMVQHGEREAALVLFDEILQAPHLHSVNALFAGRMLLELDEPDRAMAMFGIGVERAARPYQAEMCTVGIYMARIRQGQVDDVMVDDLARLAEQGTTRGVRNQAKELLGTVNRNQD